MRTHLAHLARLSVLAAGLGVGFGVLDCLRSLLFGPVTVLPPARIPEIVITYAVLWVVLAFVPAVLATVLLPRERRPAAGVVLVLGTAAVFVSAVASRHFVRTGFLSPTALLVYAAVSAGAGWLALLLIRRGTRLDRPLPWAAVAVAGIGLSFVPGLFDTEEVEEVPLVVEGERPPNVLFLLVDSLRSDHLSLYGYERRTSPNLDRFAEGAFVFETARAESNWTKPCTATILTGLPPFAHGQLEYDLKLSPSATTLAEAFRSAGSRTAAFSANVLISPVFGMDQGFERFEWRIGWMKDPFLRETLVGALFQMAGLPEPRRILDPESGDVQLDAPTLNASFLEWLDQRAPDESWFAYLHYMEPHTPYDAPDEWRLKFSDRKDAPPGHRKFGYDHHRPWERWPEIPEEERQFVVDLYDGEIAWWDHCFGELVAALESRGVLDDLVVVIVADHGQEFYEHGGWEHRQSMYDEILRVPLLFRAPGVAPGRTGVAVSTGGVFQTVLDLAGIRLERETPHPRGEALLPAPAEDRKIFSAYLPDADMESHSVVEGGWKWIYSRRAEERRVEAYELGSDPGETRDLSEAEPESGRTAVTEMLRRADVGRRLGLKADLADPGREVDDELRGLGYIR